MKAKKTQIHVFRNAFLSLLLNFWVFATAVPRHGKYFAFPGKQGFPANVASTAIYRFFWASQKPCSLQGKTHFWDPNRPAFGHNGPLFFWGSNKNHPQKTNVFGHFGQEAAKLGPQTWVVSCILGTGFSANFEPTAITGRFECRKNLAKYRAKPSF